MKTKTMTLLILGVLLALGYLMGSPAAFTEWARSNGSFFASLRTLPAEAVGIPAVRSAPGFDGPVMPTPLEQQAVWSAPASFLPTNYVTATARLYAAGMADPRGCAYREVSVVVGDVWSGVGSVVQTHGWVLPTTNDRHFAVCWNGLVYPVLALGGPADWRADARGVVTQAVSWTAAISEQRAVAPASCLALKGCILLRLGEPQLANNVWCTIQRARHRFYETPWPHGVTTNTAAQADVLCGDVDPYLEWASDWAWGLFDRAVCAHMRGDDGLALASARLLSAAWPLLEAEAVRRGFKEQRRQPDWPWETRYQDAFDFLRPLPALLADQERRALERAAHAPTSGATMSADTPARIAALIGGLEQIAVRQWSQPGGLEPWDRDPAVSALIEEGPPTIAPLLQYLERDAGCRLTRSVSFSRSFRRARTLHPVSQPAVFILLKLMDASPEVVGIDAASVGDERVSNAVLASLLRNYWQKFGRAPLAERWYGTLADDAAGAPAWRKALEELVRPVTPPQGTNHSVVAGELLRAKTAPSVTDLLVRRARSIVCTTDISRLFDVADAVTFLVDAEKWDRAAMAPIAAQLQHKIMTAYPTQRNPGYAKSLNASALARLAMLRARQGDTNALVEYAGWIQYANPSALAEAFVDSLEPFWRLPQDPALRAAAQAMFGTAATPWGTLAWLFDAHGSMHTRAILASPLLLIPEFRALVLHELTNHTVAGEAMRSGNDGLHITYTNGGMSSYGGRKDLEGIPVDVRVSFRRCDLVAEDLSAIAGFPHIVLAWSATKRDQAVRAAYGLLSTCAHRLRISAVPTRRRPVFDPLMVELEEDHSK